MQPNPTRLRTSDAEREQVATILRSAMAEGRLTLEEGEQRMATVYASRFRDELGPLTADLPNGGRQALRETPQARTATRRALGRHAGFVMLAAGVLTGLWVVSGATFFWPAIPLVFLVMGLFRHVRHGESRTWRHHSHVAPWNAPDYR
ncbi:DUF1707 domain-containing protein [Actinoplanes sp. NPDC051494]|uniref:DUF1707 domain-containing protein n=1 Tax=Actinoplanes sp. NPDC051494 TaxID=3363907 RepID=UPI0037A381B1